MSDVSLLHLAGAVPYMLVLGLMKSFSPTTYGVTIHTLARDDDAVRSVQKIAWGVAVASTLLIIVFSPINPDELIESFKGNITQVLLTRFVDFFAGVTLVLISAWLWSRRKLPRRPKVKANVLSGKAAFLFGFLNTLAGTSGIALMYVTGRVLDAVSDSLFIKVPLYAVFLVGLMGPYLLLVLIWERFPRLATIVTGAFDWVGHFDLRPLIAVLVLISGLVFLILAVLR